MRVCWKGVSHRMDDVVLVVQKSGIFAFFLQKKKQLEDVSLSLVLLCCLFVFTNAIFSN